MNHKHLFSIAAFVTFTAAALAYSPQVDSPYLGDTLALIGVIPMLMALWAGRSINNVISHRGLTHQIPTHNSAIKSRRNISPLPIVTGSLFLLALGFIRPMNIHLQFAALVGGIVLVGFGLSGISVGARQRLAPGRPDMSPLLLAIITLLAFFLRIINLEHSLHLWVDEAHFVDGITRLQDNPNTPLLSPMNFIASFTWLYSYLQAHCVALFGPTLTAPRIISAIFGTLTVPAVYFLAVQMTSTGALRDTSRKISALPLLSALLLAVFPPHVHFSRLALNNIADPLFGILTLAFLIKGIREGHVNCFILAGIFLAVTQYFYEGGKLVYPIVAVFYVGLVLFSRRIHWQHMALMLLAFLLVVMPLWITLLQGGYAYFPRVEAQHSYGPDAPALLAENGMDELTRYAHAYLAPAWHHLISNEERGGSAAHYGGAVGLILPVLIPFFLAGIISLIWHGSLIPVGVILLTVFGNSLIVNPDMSARFVVAFPFVVIVTAAGLQWFLRELPAALKLRSYIPASPFSILPINFLLILFLAIIQIVYYFGPHSDLFNDQIRPARDHQDVGWRAKDFPPGTQVYLFTDELTFLPHIEIMEAYFDVEINIHINHPLHLMLRGNARLPDDADLAIFLQPHNRALLRYLSRSFTLPAPQYSPYNIPEDKQYALYYFARFATAE